MTSPIATSLGRQAAALESYLRSEHRAGTPEGLFALHVYDSVGESGPVSDWGALPAVEELRQGHAPVLAAASYAFTRQKAPPSPAHVAAWEDGVRRLAGRNAFPMDRQTFAFRPTEAYGLALGVTRLLPAGHELRVWLQGVFGRLDRESGDNPTDRPLNAAAAAALGVAWLLRTEADDAAPEELALRRWLLQSRAPANSETGKAIGCIDDKLLRAAVLAELCPADVAKAALLHQALRRAVQERLESSIEATWLIRQDSADATAVIVNLCRRFPLFAKQVQKRHDNRRTITFKDEYDVQDAMHAILKLHFDDVRAEEWSPSFAGSASRIDFLLKRERIAMEIKMTRKSLSQKDVVNQLIQDKERYRTHPDYRTLICIVYDPDKHMHNPTALEADVSEVNGGYRVVAVVSPSGI